MRYLNRESLMLLDHMLWFGVGEDWSFLIRKLEIEGEDAELPLANARTLWHSATPDHPYPYLGVWCHEYMLQAELHSVIGILAHEAVHVVDFMFESMDEVVKPREIHAYLIGNITTILYRFLQERRSHYRALIG